MNVELDADERLFSVCANGKLGDLKNLISYTTSTLKLDSSNSRGWTALMFAARNGHVDITKTLVKEGVKLDAMNNLGQTAYDIASFWNHKEVMSLLSLPDDNLPQEPVHFFTVKNLDRASEKRKDSDWLKPNLASSPNSRILVFVKTFPVIEAEGKLVDLKLFKYNEVDSYIDVEDLDKSEVVLLGVDHEKDLTYFAINIDKDKGKELIKSSTDNLYVLERIRDAFILSTEQAALAGLAHSMFDWHNRCRYCQTCGSVTRFSEGGYKRTCTNQTCLTVREIKNSSYPRLDPTIIASVVSPDKSKLLLARGLRFPTPNMWSCLAGFMEPGESIEDACRREVFEEAGVTLGKVTYHSSQPWPFPTQLMIGLTGQATSETITVDTSELADARWFSRAEVVSMMMRKHPDGLVIPPHQAIAHHLIKSFLHQSTSTNSKL